MNGFEKSLMVMVCLLLGFNAFGQEKEKKLSKKQQAMVDWYASEEKREKYEKAMLEAHALFQDKQYQQAQTRYQEALTIQPGDQQATAKITDIQVIMDSIAAAGVSPTVVQEPVVEAESEVVVAPTPEPVPAVSLNESIAQETPEEPLPEAQPEAPETPIVEEEVAPLQAAPQPKPKPAAAPKPPKRTAPKPNMDKPAVDKSSPEFQMALAKEFPEGWTEESFREGTKSVNRRIFVAKGKGIEYLKVVHDWGGIYHFRNGTPITADLWKEETAEVNP